jgi:signal transduction histidine kinase
VSELIAAARRIGAGDFDVLGSSERKDELGELAAALRAMSAELRAARAKMADEVEARIRALEQLRHAERLATLGQLASVLAHEIGTPLNVIAGHAKLIATSKLDTAGIHESSLAIGAQCERVTQIIRRILDYARRKPPRRSWIRGSDVMRQSRELLSGLAEQRRVRLTFEGVEANDALFADAGQLQQAIINLLLNAIHASPEEAAVDLSITTAAGTAPGQSEDHYVVLSVQDRGEGIPPSEHDHIFEPFFTTKPAGEGTGRGLAVAREIVREHGGFVQVRSATTKGSTFSLYLPRGGEECRPES